MRSVVQMGPHDLALKLLLSLAMLVWAAHGNADPLFEDTTTIEVELVGPLQSVLDAADAPEELPFVLRANGIDHAIKVRVRGKSRRRVCSFPPLRLNFVKKDSSGSIFEGQNKLKLVTHCRTRRSAETDALQEYAAYRIFSILSNFAYRVRPLHITYIDSSSSGDSAFKRYGFVIESASELAERIGGQTAKVTEVSLQALNLEQAATVFVFQYLIGNTDWSLVTADDDDSCCHNGDLFDVGSDRYYVPYDFDLAGLVNALYARPDPSLRISKVTQRLYRGYCISSDALQSALAAVKARRIAILEEISQVPGLSQRERTATVRYLERFFRQANDEARMLRMFESRCL